MWKVLRKKIPYVWYAVHRPISLEVWFPYLFVVSWRTAWLPPVNLKDNEIVGSCVNLVVFPSVASGTESAVVKLSHGLNHWGWSLPSGMCPTCKQVCGWECVYVEASEKWLLVGEVPLAVKHEANSWSVCTDWLKKKDFYVSACPLHQTCVDYVRMKWSIVGVDWTALCASMMFNNTDVWKLYNKNHLTNTQERLNLQHTCISLA